MNRQLDLHDITAKTKCTRCKEMFKDTHKWANDEVCKSCYMILERAYFHIGEENE